MTGSRLPLWGTVAGIIVGTAISVGLVTGGVLRVPVARDLSDAQGDFLDAWQRSRTGTFIVDSDFRRIVDGRTLYSPSQLVQRPPDRILRQFSGISGTVDGHPLVCSTDQAGHFACVPGSVAAAPYDDVVRKEVDDLRSYFTPPQTGAKPLYRVLRGQESGCFELFRQIPYDDAPYGSFSRLCFDASTGALRSLERHLDGGAVERQDAVSIRTNVMLGDFDTTSNEGYGTSMDAPDAPVVQGGSAGTAPPGTAAAADVTRLGSDELIDEGSNVAIGDRQLYVDEAVARLSNGRMSVNDAAWRTSSGDPKALADPVVRELLRRGARPPVAP